MNQIENLFLAFCSVFLTVVGWGATAISPSIGHVLHHCHPYGKTCIVLQYHPIGQPRVPSFTQGRYGAVESALSR